MTPRRLLRCFVFPLIPIRAAAWWVGLGRFFAATLTEPFEQEKIAL
jgi:hypothetical protein